MAFDKEEVIRHVGKRNVRLPLDCMCRLSFVKYSKWRESASQYVLDYSSASFTIIFLALGLILLLPYPRG